MALDATAWYAIILLACGAVFWTWRLGQAQTERARTETARVQRISERLLQAKSLREVDDALRRGFQDSRWKVETQVYFYRRASRHLETLDGDSVDIHSPQHGAPSLLATTFRNRVAVLSSDPGSSGYLVPMLTGEDAAGVIVFSGADIRDLDRGSLQHLANQAGAAARAIDQQAAQEHHFRHEKLATASQFVQAVAMELREVATESPRAHALVDRLLAMGRAEAGDAQPVRLAELLNGIFTAHEQQWAERQIEAPDAVEANEALQVLGSRHQLEQIFSALLEAAAAVRPPALDVSASVRTRRARVEIRFSPLVAGQVLTDSRRGLVQAALRAMGGELSVSEALPVRFEVELPLYAPAVALRDAARDARTALVVEPDPTERWQLVQLVAQRGLRVVPVETPDDALDRFAQYPFDVVFCPWQNGRPEALRLLEHAFLTERPVQAFVIAEPTDATVETAVEGRAAVLRKPVRDADLFPLLPAV